MYCTVKKESDYRENTYTYSMENTKITQEWLNKQTYETLADIVEMLYCTHTIDIPEWSEMTAEKIKTRCEEWGVQEGDNVYHSRNRLRNVSKDATTDEYQSESEDSEVSESETDEDMPELIPINRVVSRKA